MANAYVFPGGRVDGSDGSDEILVRIRGLDLGELCGQMDGVSSDREAASYVIAVARETFEEAGILLARDEAGEWVDLTDRSTAKRLAHWRNRLNAGETSFERLLMEEGLYVAGEGLHYFDHWVTPAQERRRYDARFFVVSAPPKQRGRHDGHETTESVWHTPGEAIEAHSRGELMLPPPTWRVLMDLAQWPTREEMLADLASDPTVVRTEPRFIQDGGAFALALPGDPEHDDPQGRRFGARRIVLDAGCWAER